MPRLPGEHLFAGPRMKKTVAVRLYFPRPRFSCGGWLLCLPDSFGHCIYRNCVNQKYMSRKYHARVVGALCTVIATLFLSAAGHGAESALKSGIDQSTFDASVKPGDNFFEYVNGT